MILRENGGRQTRSKHEACRRTHFKVYGGRRGYTCKGTSAVLTEHHAEHNNIRTINLI